MKHALYRDSRTNYSDESGDDDNLGELTSRYFLHGRSELNKKLHSGDSAVPPKFASSFQSSMATSETNRNGVINVSGSRHVNISANISSSSAIAEDDDNGWISVGPKHQRGHHDRHRKKSFGQDGFERRKSQSGHQRPPRRSSTGRGPRPNLFEGASPAKPISVPQLSSSQEEHSTLTQVYGNGTSLPVTDDAGEEQQV
jgi:hypothetical protein